MFKNTTYLIALILVTIVINAVVTRWFYPTPPQTDDREQLEQVVQGIKQQSTSISTLETNLKKLNLEISRLDAKTSQALTQPAVTSTPATEASAATPTSVPDEHLTKIDQQLADLQQQLAALLANSNQVNDLQNTATPKPDPYAGMTKEQIQQQEDLAIQQQQQLLDNTLAATPDPSRTSAVSGKFESYMNTANYKGTLPKVDCGTTLCRFQFAQDTLKNSAGEDMDPMLVLMESGTFPADGTKRQIVTQTNAQGGMDLYVGNADDFPKTPSQ